MSYYLQLLKNFFTLVKSKLILLIQVVLAFLVPIKVHILLVGAMIMLDTITGLIKAYKTHEPITSRKLSRVISKMVLYQVSLITFYCLDFYLLGEFVSLFTSKSLVLTKVVAGFLCTVELVSLNENIKAITGMNPYRMFMNYLLRIKEVKEQITDLAKEKKENEG